MADPRSNPSSAAVLVLAAVAVIGLVAWTLGAVIDVALIIFAGILLAVFLCGVTDWLDRHTPLSRGWALGVTIAAIAGVFVAGAAYLAPSLAAQVDELSRHLPQAVRWVEGRIEQYAWGQMLLQHLSDSGGLLRVEPALKGAGLLVSSSVTALAGAVVVLFVGLFLAVDPAIYRRGLLRLIPIARRTQAAEVLDDMGHNLRRWLLGRLVAMAIVGVTTGIGLSILGVPGALALAAVAAVLTFIPYIGAVLSSVPAILVALLQGPATAGYVIALYLGVHVVEGYVLTPLIQKSAISLPPALLLAAQALMGALVGWLGLVLATPVLAVLVVLAKRLYVEGMLGDTTVDHGEDTPLPGVSERQRRAP